MPTQSNAISPNQPSALMPPIAVPSYLKISRILTYIVRIWATVGIFALAMRIFLLATSANPETPFVQFIYNLSGDYLNPFRGIFPAKPIGDTGYFDTAAAFAIICYLFLMWAAAELINYIDYKITVYKRKKVLELQRLELEEEKARQEVQVMVNGQVPSNKAQVKPTAAKQTR